MATIDPGIEYDRRTLTGLGKLAGLGDAILAEDDAVSKVGRTTGKTEGRVTAFELDDVVVQFDIGLSGSTASSRSRGRTTIRSAWAATAAR